ncbi:MAG: GMC family oxidoreductase [Saprospirales bacterium]|nr:GMC family oxidoreductase [Saprospirales bacterium]
MKTENFDYIVIGSGFGGSVSAMRLSEKGYRVLVLEKGKRYRDRDFAKTNWQIRKYLWAPLLRCFGIQQLSFFREVMVLHGVGVGGGSLVYANTHMEPGDEFYQHPAWFQFRDWKEALAPHYRKARYMLGSTPARNGNIDDRLLAEVAEEMGQGHTFKGVDVGVYYGDPDQPKDPYFGGKGPLRNGCIECAGCMVGCRHNAKNTLDKTTSISPNNTALRSRRRPSPPGSNGTQRKKHTRSTPEAVRLSLAEAIKHTVPKASCSAPGCWGP